MSETPKDDANPTDQLNVQLPGRMMAVEILLVLLLRQKANVGKLFAMADEILTVLEASEVKNAPPERARYTLQVFGSARASLDHLSGEAQRRQGPRHQP